MRFTYCPHCGTKLIQKEIGDEGVLPFCERCCVPFWETFSTCVICAVVNEFDEVALLRQNYVTNSSYVCVAGYMKPGESAEETARREIQEEIGQDVERLEFIASYPFQRKELLMLGFKATVRKQAFQLSREVDAAEWFPLENATDHLRTGSIAWQLVNTIKEQL